MMELGMTRTPAALNRVTVFKVDSGLPRPVPLAMSRFKFHDLFQVTQASTDPGRAVVTVLVRRRGSRYRDRDRD